MAVSRGNAKVKTTQELIASLQNKSSSLGVVAQTKSKEDLMEKAAKLTERVSIIDQKLNTSGNRYKNSQKKNSSFRNDRILESGSVTNVERSPGDDKSHNRSSHTDDEIIVVDEETDIHSEIKPSDKLSQAHQSDDTGMPKSLSVEDALALLPPVDKSCLYEADEDTEDVPCTCFLEECKTDFSIEVEDPEGEEDATKRVRNQIEEEKPKFEFKQDCNCQAKLYLENKYHLGAVTDDRVCKLRDCFVPGLNGNLSADCASAGPDMSANGLYVNVVPNRNTERIPKYFDGATGEDFACENFKKYSISEEEEEEHEGAEKRCGNEDISDGTNTNSNNNNHSNHSTLDAAVTSDVGGDARENKSSERSSATAATTFREWHEVVETPSYNGEIFKILPYVIID
ncbi:hypothetical protein AMK59_3355 [Oryctes borbonicus]|uniref:Uncharacterized protein n=1 Tax=Oryctes borbonicus TaxID=1629725 RepID=A0A0T6B4S8_9SCAR|nr:hypothetical protein AMK59_3355 [Oryctes borbonicus]